MKKRWAGGMLLVVLSLLAGCGTPTVCPAIARPNSVQITLSAQPETASLVEMCVHGKCSQPAAETEVNTETKKSTHYTAHRDSDTQWTVWIDNDDMPPRAMVRVLGAHGDLLAQQAVDLNWERDDRKCHDESHARITVNLNA